MTKDLPPLVIVPVVADSLALAMVETSDVPIVLLDGGLSVIAASASFARAFHLDPASIPGTSMFALGSGEWDVPQLRSPAEGNPDGRGRRPGL